jgi:hypothetical protein
MLGQYNWNSYTKFDIYVVFIFCINMSVILIIYHSSYPMHKACFYMDKITEMGFNTQCYHTVYSCSM